MPGFFDRLIGRKASATTRVVVGSLMSAKQAVYTPRDYKRLAEQGYEWNTWVYACVNQVARTSAGIPWIVYEGTGQSGQRFARDLRRAQYGPGARHAIQRAVERKALRELDTHPILELFTRPNGEQGGAAFMEAYFGYKLLAGNSYVEAVRMGTRPPVELWTLRPDRMRVLPNEKNRIGGYQYKAGGGEVTFKLGEVMHSKFFHPTNDWYGMSPIEAAARAVDGDNAAQAWNTAMVQNGARPSGALVTEGELDPQQKLDLKEAMDERSRPEAAGRALLLEGGLTWQEMGLTPRDMDWINQQKWGLKRIAAAFGVPMPLVDPESSATYANYKTARVALYQDTVLPGMDNARDDFNGWLVPMYGENLLLAYDPDRIEALQDDRNDAWARTNDPRMTLDERREAVGMDPLPDGVGAVIVLPTGSSVRELTALPDTEQDTAQSVAVGIGDEGNADIGGLKRKSVSVLSLSAQAWLDQTAAARARLITDSTRMRVATTVSAGATAGHSTAAIADEVRRLYAEMGEYRADLIARSEVITAANAGARFAALSTGIDLTREWLADKEARDAHQEADGQQRSMFDPYDVAGHSCMFPGDPALPASHACGCRCGELFYPARKTLIRERRSEVWAQHAEYRQAWEQTLRENASSLFAAEGDTVAATIARAADTAAAIRVCEALPQEPWAALYRSVYRAVMEDFGGRALEQLR